MRVMALFSTSFFVGEDGPGRGHLCHTDTFLVLHLSIHRSVENEILKDLCSAETLESPL